MSLDDPQTPIEHLARAQHWLHGAERPDASKDETSTFALLGIGHALLAIGLLTHEQAHTLTVEHIAYKEPT